MRKALFGFSFDDGRVDNFTLAYPVLTQYKLPATFNINVAYLEGKGSDFTAVEPMTMEMVRTLHQDPRMEIATHGYWHNSLTDNLIHGVEALCGHLKVDALYKGGIGVALTTVDAPHDDMQTIVSTLTRHGVTYVRRSLRYSQHRGWNILMRKANRVVPMPMLMRGAFADTLMTAPEGRWLYSIPLVSTMPYHNLKTMVDLAVRRGAACIFMMHSVGPDDRPQDIYSMKMSVFKRLCEDLAQMQQQKIITVATSYDIFQTMCRQSVDDSHL